MKTNWPAFRCGCLILSSAVLGVSPMLAQTQEPAGATAASAVISSVAITQAPQRASVRVEGEGRLDAHVSRMQNPERLVLDFSGTRLAVDKTVIPGVSEPVRDVRLGQYRPNVARVVVDLTGVSPYQISHDGPAVVVLFEAQPEAPSAGPSNPQTVTSEQEPKTHAAFEYSAAAPHSSARPSSSLQIPAPRFALPGELTQPSVVLASFGRSNEPARPATAQDAAQQAAQASNAAANRLAASSAQAQQSQASAPPAAVGKYTGEPISVNLKDVDLRDFFRLIHEISGLNVVLDPAVKGTLTIVLDEVPWDQALDIVLQNNGLDKQLNGNVLRIATRTTLKTEAETQRDLEKAQAEAIAPVTVTRVLSYAKAATMKDTLKKFLSARGDILSDDRSNQIIIRDIPSVIPTIDNLLHQLDRKSQQVEIEARVISASRAFSQDIGTELGFAGTTTGGRSVYCRCSAGWRQPHRDGIGSSSAAGDRYADRHLQWVYHPRHSAGYEPGSWSSDEWPLLRPPFAQLRYRLLYHGGGSQGRWQAALQTAHRDAEQRKGGHQAGRQAAHSDDHQQHDLGAVHRRRVAVGSDAANYHRRHNLHGRPRRKHAD